MNANQKRIALIAAGAVALYLIYKWQQSRSDQSSTTGAVAPDSAGTASDYASLAGQEQGDVAALQGQNSQLLSQEQSDVAALTGSLGALSAQEQGDISGLTGQIAGFSNQFDQLTAATSDLQAAVPALAAGVDQINRAQNATIQTHRGGPFYNYYVQVTGHAPPANVRTSSFFYQAWKSGVKSSALQSHPPAHPSSKNTHVAHPNTNHTQQHHVKPAPPKPPPARRGTAPAKPKPKSKPKPPARRK